MISHYSSQNQNLLGKAQAKTNKQYVANNNLKIKSRRSVLEFDRRGHSNPFRILGGIPPSKTKQPDARTESTKHES